MSSRYTDTVYNQNSPTQQNRRAGLGGPDDPYVSSAGYSSNEERLTSQSLVSALDGAPPPGPRGVLFPPRFVGERTQPSISDVLSLPTHKMILDSSAEFSNTNGSYSGGGSNGPALGIGA